MPTKNHQLSVTFSSAIRTVSLGDLDCKVGDLLERLYEYSDIREHWFFGIQHNVSGGPAFAKLHKKLHKYKSPGSNAVNLWLKVRYYPKDIIEVIEDTAWTQFYQEAKQAILSGEIHCPSEKAIVLASYQACIEFGVYRPEIYTADNFKLSDILSEHLREVHHDMNEEQWMKQIGSLHQEHGDITKEDATLEYLKIAQELDMYGVAYYPITNKQGTKLLLGLSAFGLNIYKENNKLTPTIGFEWSEIKQVQYNGLKLAIIPREKTAPRIVCWCPSTAIVIEIVDTCSGYNALWDKLKGLNKIGVIQQFKDLAMQKKEDRQVERIRLATERSAREAAEKRVLTMEQALQERQKAYEQSQSRLSESQKRVDDLEELLELEKKARVELEEMQQSLHKVNQLLERESQASAEERAQLQLQKEQVELEITRQREVIVAQEAEKQRLEELVQKSSENEEEENSEHDTEFAEDNKNEIPEVTLNDDVDFAKQLSKIKSELEVVKDTSKQNDLDVLYEENLRKGMNKYQTLHQIRQGNTKKRAEQFESL